ncbi:hypothetical protein GOP47_0003451 [Adiantum capillus-veneris]|uniref:TRAF-type domain-containing protein n=1 Tax=Adiantum capillus-veneris TaxID=13818 RepID=A0A9D4ZQ56_ADICA|nr:hypothetical protein GOP47_0003451 [Adiantum capillus-veneris]
MERNTESGDVECEYYDVEQVHAVARYLLRTVATACIEKTYGDLFRSPVSALDEAKKELIDFLHTRPPSPPSDLNATHSPSDRAKALLDQFVHSKTKLLSRVSSKLVSADKKEDKIEELEQDLQHNEKWIFGQRERIAKDFIKALDSTRSSICALKFSSHEELAEHKSICPFKPITCENQGCGHVLSGLHGAEHDAVCGYKLLPCEQACDALIMRSQMDKHCITTCPMKLVQCPFFHVGCGHTLPQGMVEEHCSASMGSHLNSVLHSMQKQDVVVSSLTQRILLLEKALSISQRSEAVDLGNLSLTVRQQDAKIKSLESEAGKLRQELKQANMSSEVQKLRRELQTLQKKFES